jgi:hypothetical protein
MEMLCLARYVILVPMSSHYRINQQPTLDQPANRNMREDAGLQTINLTGIRAGTGESQTITITASSCNPALIPHPLVSYTSPNATGSLSFTAVANASGTATIMVTVRDSRGTAGGGIDTLTQNLTLTITAVNDAPSFTAGPNQTVQASADMLSVSGWTWAEAAGPAAEASQTLRGYIEEVQTPVPRASFWLSRSIVCDIVADLSERAFLSFGQHYRDSLPHPSCYNAPCRDARNPRCLIARSRHVTEQRSQALVSKQLKPEWRTDRAAFLARLVVRRVAREEATP